MKFEIGDEVLTRCPRSMAKYHNKIGIIISTKGDYESGGIIHTSWPYVLDVFPDVGYAEDELVLTPDFEHSLAVNALSEDYFA